jgi:hypothetical protein
MHLLLLARPTCHSKVTTSAGYSETRTATRDTITRNLALRRTRRRRRRAVLLTACSLPLVWVVSPLVLLSATNLVGPTPSPTNSTNTQQPTTAATTRSSSPTLLRLLLLLLVVMAPIRMPSKATALPRHKTRTAIRRSKNRLLFLPTMQTVTPSRVVTVSRWRKSARSSSRRRKSIKRRSKTTTTTTTRRFVRSLGRSVEGVRNWDIYGLFPVSST